MKYDLQKELPIIILTLLPILYLAFIWGELPEKVPLHWNGAGEVDRWGSKNQLWWLMMLITVPSYLIFTIIPTIDPKNKIQEMGGKFYQIKFVTMTFLAVLALFILNAVQSQSMNSSVIFILVGLLFATLGNFFQSIKPNYFLGIRTPWTLENEQVWKDTHRMAGLFWIAGGLAIVILSLVFAHNSEMVAYLLVGVVLVLVLVPVTYSYFRFKSINRSL